MTTKLPKLPEPYYSKGELFTAISDSDLYTADQTEAYARAAVADALRPCTCHPDDSPPVPCAKKYALTDCKAAGDNAEHVRVLEAVLSGDGWMDISTDALTAALTAAIAALSAPKAEAVEGGPEDACYSAYQAVGVMLSDLGIFDTERGQNLLDNLSQARLVHDVLPWPSVKPESGGQGEAVATVCLRGDRYGHDNFIEVQLQKAPGVDFPIGTKLYTHPPASVAVRVTKQMCYQAIDAYTEATGEGWQMPCVKGMYAALEAALAQGGKP